MSCSPSSRLNVLVMHPEPIVCAGVVATLRMNPNFDVLVHGEERPAPGAMTIDVVIADYDSALQLVAGEAATMDTPPIPPRIMALAASGREADIRRAVEAGIHGYLLLDGSLDDLVEAVTALGSGAKYLCALAAQRVADSFAATALTLREHEVLGLVALGHSNKSIARQLDVELATVKAHVSAIMSKFGAISRTHATSIAAARGLVAAYGSPRHSDHPRSSEPPPMPRRPQHSLSTWRSQ